MFSKRRSKRSSKKLNHAAWSAASTPGKGHGSTGNSTPLKRARLRATPGARHGGTVSVTPSSAGPAPLTAASALPSGLRALPGQLPALLQTRLAASRQHGAAAGRVSSSGKWHTVVCEGKLFVWAINENTNNVNSPPLLSTIDLPDTQSVDADQLGRLCVLESEASLSNMSTPTMLYVTPWGEVQCWRAIGQADGSDATCQLPDLAAGKSLYFCVVFLASSSGSSYASGILLTHSIIQRGAPSRP